MQVFLARHQLMDMDTNQRLISQAKGRPGYALELASRHHEDLTQIAEELASAHPTLYRLPRRSVS